ncbi:MAG: GNAT family N-acetyltransferase [Candidatus Binatia bacterium]
MSDEIRIGPLDPADAPQLTACFERCYGRSYIATFFYDPDAIRARMRDGRLQPVVATMPDGTIVGHMALTRRHAQALTLEAGNTIVDPSQRSQGLAARLGAALFEVCRDGGGIGFHHYPTTAHGVMQKLAVQGGGVETGIMLGYVPAGVDYKDIGGASADRLAVVTVYQPLAPAPARSVSVPPRYAAVVHELYGKAGFARAMHPAVPPSSSSTSVLHTTVAAPGVVQIAVERVGADLAAAVAQAASDAAALVTHVDLPLDDPGTPAAVEALRPAGFFYCALMPEFAASDVLRLQHLHPAAEPSTLPELVNPEARALLQFAMADRA